MTDEEWIKTIPFLSATALLENLDYCGYDSYYRTIREPVIAEIDKRLRKYEQLEKENAELIQDKYNLEYKIENLENKIEHHQEVIDTLKKVNAKLRQIILGNEEEMSGMKDNLNEAQRLLSDWVSDKPSTVSEHKDLISDTENLLKELYL